MGFLQIIGKKGCIEILFCIRDNINSFSNIRNSLIIAKGLTLSTRTLSERLYELEKEELIKKKNGKYYLTKKGVEAIEIIENILQWEKRWEETKFPKIIFGMLGDKERGEQ